MQRLFASRCRSSSSQEVDELKRAIIMIRASQELSKERHTSWTAFAQIGLVWRV